MSNTAANVRRSDGSRFYTIHGEPVYEIPKKRGDGMKKPNINDAIELGLLPSVTTVIKTVDKPALNRWLREQACLAVLTTPRQPGEALDKFVDRVLNVEMVDQEEAKMAADKGTAIHAAIEDALNGKPYEEQWRPFVIPVLDQLDRFGKRVWSEKVVVGDGYAGRSDVLMDDRRILTLGDFKTSGKLPEKEAYAEHCMQVGAYSNTLGNVADRHIQTALIYISTAEPGRIITHIQENWQRHYEAFRHLLQVWKYMNGII